MNVVENVNGVKIYNVSAGKSVPTIIKERGNKRKARGQEYSKSLQLIQDFEFPSSATKLKVSNDGQFLIAAGLTHNIYILYNLQQGGFAPQMRIFDLRQLSLKCERHVELEVVDFEILSEDYQKLVLLRMDRNLEFHAQFGKYYNLRIPKVLLIIFNTYTCHS
jgi:ribosome biogenesis protein ENP2